MKIVVRIGGSLSLTETGPNPDYFKKILPILEKIKNEHQLVISIGGGKLVRKYNENISDFGLTDNQKEKTFIKLLHANAIFLSALLKTQPIFSIDEINDKTEGVISGTVPGRSTDGSAALVAEIIKADVFIKLTNVDGIYTSDPNTDSSARKIDKMSYSDLRKYTNDKGPVKYGVLDGLAIDTLERNGIRTVVINGEDPENLIKIINGESLGTVIS